MSRVCCNVVTVTVGSLSAGAEREKVGLTRFNGTAYVVSFLIITHATVSPSLISIASEEHVSILKSYSSTQRKVSSH